ALVQVRFDYGEEKRRVERKSESDWNRDGRIKYRRNCTISPVKVQIDSTYYPHHESSHPWNMEPVVYVTQTAWEHPVHRCGEKHERRIDDNPRRVYHPTHKQ